MFPIGFMGGFICAFVIVSGCVLLNLWFGRLEYHTEDIGLYILYAAACGYAPGGMLGFLLTPLAYFVCFTKLNNRDLFRISCLITVGTIFFGLLGGLVNELYALLTTFIGFIGSILAAFSYVKDKEAKQVIGRGAG